MWYNNKTFFTQTYLYCLEINKWAKVYQAIMHQKRKVSTLMELNLQKEQRIETHSRYKV